MLQAVSAGLAAARGAGLAGTIPQARSGLTSPPTCKTALPKSYAAVTRGAAKKPSNQATLQPTAEQEPL